MRLKKILVIFCVIIFFINIGNITLAKTFTQGCGYYDLSGRAMSVKYNIRYDSIVTKDGQEIELAKINYPAEIEVHHDVLSIANENERFIIMDLQAENYDTAYPETEKTNISVVTRDSAGGRGDFIGKNYRLFHVDNQADSITDISTQIVKSEKRKAVFEIDKLGIYILLFAPNIYDVIFYYEDPLYNDEREIINPDCIYSTINNLNKWDVVGFPEIPQMDGYVFLGWQVDAPNGDRYYPSSQPLTAGAYYAYYATWCKEEEYEPLKITVTAEENIKKGKEDGKKVTVKTNYGVFAYNGMYEDWPAHWGVAGSDEITVESATIIDDKTVELVLSGNSEDKYTNSEIYIEFDSSLLLGGVYEEDGETLYYEPEKIKIDEDGIRAKTYRSDNSITLTKQKKKRTSGGGVSLPSMYTVTFNTSGGSEIKTQTLSSGSLVNLPDNPEKEGYVFGGWFIDKELTKEYNFEDKLTKNLILYAKWEEEDKTSEQIIFTVGDKTAMVFGEEKQNDVAPVIRSDRAFLPARFVAEALGAEVLWNEKTKTVTITKGDAKIVITVGADSAMINGKSTSLDAPAFIENDRTYTPIRLIAEALAAKVLWNPDEQNITITKQ